MLSSYRNSLYHSSLLDGGTQGIPHKHWLLLRSAVMKAYARKNKPTDRPGRRSKRLKFRTAPPPPPAPSAPPSPPAAAPPSVNLYYEAAWTDSWSHRRCLHEHRTLSEAAKCAMPHGCGWYVFAVEDSEPRQLSDEEDKIVNRLRFGKS